MAPKRYQERVLREVTIFLEALASQQAVGNSRHAASDAWDEAKNQLHVPGPYQQRRNGLGKDLPTSLARLLARQDRREEARSILAATYAWVTEGFDTGDLREAKSLLDALSPD